MQARLAIPARRDPREHHHAAIGGPGRGLVKERFGQRLFSGSVRAHGGDVEAVAQLLGEGDQVALGRPGRGSIAPVAKADPRRLAPVHAHDIQLRIARAVGFEHDPLPVRAERGRRVDGGRLHQRALRARCRVHQPDIGVAALFAGINDPASIGAEARRERHAVRVLRHRAGRDGRHLHHPDLRESAVETGVNQPPPVARELRRQHQGRAVGHPQDVLPVIIHHADPLDPRVLWPGFLDKGHAAVEIGLLARQAGIDLVGDLVGGPAPVAGAGVELHPVALGLTRINVIQPELDADRIARLRHLGRNERLRADRPPVLEGDGLAKAAGRNGRIGGDFAEQARAGQVGGHHAADLLGHRRVAVKGRNGDGHGFRHAVGDLDLQRAVLRQRGQGGQRGGQGHRQGHGQRPKHHILIIPATGPEMIRRQSNPIPSGRNSTTTSRQRPYLSMGRGKPAPPHIMIARRATSKACWAPPSEPPR